MVLFSLLVMTVTMKSSRAYVKSVMCWCSLVPTLSALCVSHACCLHSSCLCMLDILLSQVLVFLMQCLKNVLPVFELKWFQIQRYSFRPFSPYYVLILEFNSLSFLELHVLILWLWCVHCSAILSIWKYPKTRLLVWALWGKFLNICRIHY